jgi:hypothetical protein
MEISYLIRVNPYFGRMQDHWNFSILTELLSAEGSFFRQTQFLIKKYVFQLFFMPSQIAVEGIFRKHEFEITNYIVFIQGFIAACDIHFSFFLPCSYYSRNIRFILVGSLNPRLKSRYKSSLLLFRSLYIRFYKVLSICSHGQTNIYRLFWVFL